MTPSSRARVLSGVAAGLTVTGLFAATITAPAVAAPLPDPVHATSKIKLAGGAAASRVIKDRYLVETVATPLARGGSKLSNKATSDATKAAARTAGIKVAGTFADLWSGVSVTATEAQIRQLAQAPSVKAVYPVLRVAMPKTTRSATSVSSALDQVSALGLSQDGSGVKVGVIDTGIDYDNTDLGGSGSDGGSFPTARVAFGYDFVGDDYNPDSDDPADWSPLADADPDDCAGHGTHVAGIVGAQGSGDGSSTTGVAPAATLGAYRVFGCEGSTDTDVILQAMTRARTDGMNVVNMSLGSDFDSWPSYPDAVAAANLAKAGVTVVVSAGNSGDTGLFSVGTPAVGAGVISVASYEPQTIRVKAISVNGSKYPYTAVAGTADAPADNTTALTLRAASNTLACTTPAAVPADTALLVKRGDCAFSDKVASALAAGAEAVVIYNNVPALDSFTAEREGQPAFTIPAISIHGTQGEAIAALLTASGPQNMVWMDYQKDVVNPDGGFISDFSSAGLAADLSLVPTISAPGAKIYSTLPIEQGGHGNMSGTSMASPYVAGAAALVLQAKGALTKPATVAQLLYNTAAPVMKSGEAGVETRPEGVFRQGSGLMNVANAINAGVTASPSTLKLGEGTSHTVTITLTNKTTGPLTYKASRVSGVSAAASTSGGDQVGTTTPLYGFGDVGFKAYSKSVTIKAGKTGKIKVKLTAPSKVLKGKAGLLYGGWVQFTTTGVGGNTVTVPFAGVRGDYQSVKLLNKFKYQPQTGAAWTLPTLGYSDNQGFLYPETGTGRTYTMAEIASNIYDDPFVIFHLDYPATDLRMKVINTKTRKSYYAILDPSSYNPSTGKISEKSTHLYKQSRDVSAQAVELIGLYNKGKAYNVPNGTYKLELRVLKPLGSSSKSKHWESYTTRTFVIAG